MTQIKQCEYHQAFIIIKKNFKKKTAYWGGWPGKLCREGRSLSRCPPSLTTPPVLPHAQATLPSTSLTPKPACLFQQVQIASFNGGKKKTQVVISVIGREHLTGQDPADSYSRGPWVGCMEHLRSGRGGAGE